MASLATIMNRFVGARELAEARPVVWNRSESCRLRPIANEDVYLYVKRIDNSAVVRAADPVARRARSRSVGMGFVAALLVIAGLIPAAYNTMAGFTLQTLRTDQEKLKQQRTLLDIKEAKLLSPERLEGLAKSLNMMEPVPQQVQYLDGTATRDARIILPAAMAPAGAR